MKGRILMNQLTFSDIEYSNRKKKPNVKNFLMPWKKSSHGRTG